MYSRKGGVSIRHSSLFKPQNILDMDVTALASRIQHKHISSIDVTSAFIEQIKSINPKIQCVVEERFSDALLEGVKCDQLIAEYKHAGKLFGVPISVKECVDVEGMKTTGGLKHRKNYIADKDAESVRRLKEAGAIVLCKTNTSTGCLTLESNNKLYGRTNNPWNHSRTAGGSSGGEAALIASGGAAAGIGSDLAGSLRMPGHFNGVVSMKASNDSIPLTGHFPKPIHEIQQSMLALGPITKTVSDAEIMYQVMANKEPTPINPSNFRVNVPSIPNKYPLSEDTADALQEVRQLFLDGPLIEEDIPDFIWKLPLLHLKVLTINGAEDMYPDFFGKENFPLLRTMFQEASSQNTDYDYPFLKTLFLAKAGSFVFRTKENSKNVKKLEDTILEWKKQMDQLLDGTVFILPVFPKPSDRHHRVSKTILSNRFLYRKWMPYTVLPNVLDFPALSIPIYRSDNQLPISVQLIAKSGQEDALFYFGRKLERHFQTYERAPI